MMEIYILDENFYEIDVIDSYESFIWTERFDSIGDFELVMHPNEDIRMRLVPGTLLSIKASRRTMMVEKIHEKPIGEGRVKTTYTGVSLEKILYHRVANIYKMLTVKTALYSTVNRSLVNGDHSADDRLLGLAMGINKLYPASTIPPDMGPLPPDWVGWTKVGQMHDDATKLSPLGFRIVREPGTREIYYDNYTGNDRSTPGRFEISDTTLAWPNPNMFESHSRANVWINMASNPGFTTLKKNLNITQTARYTREYEYSGELDGSIVDSDTSKSGKALELRVRSSGGTNDTYALASDRAMSLLAFHGSQMTISITITVNTIQFGTPNPYARSLQLRVGTHASPDGPIQFTLQAPNTVGVHKLTRTFTFPSAGTYTTYQFRLYNGSSYEDSSVTFSDLVMVQLPSNPIGYFDGEYTPDPDLIPVGHGINEPGWSYLYGSTFPGITSVGCRVIQSRKYGNGGVSARIIRNIGSSSDHYATLTLDSPAKKLLLNRYQQGPLSPVLSNFGKVELLEGDTLRASSSAKDNIGTEDQVSLELSDGVADKVIIRGGHTELGGSMWFDRVVATADPNWSFKPSEPVLFAEDLDSFIVSESLESFSNYYNVAMVTHLGRNDVVLVDDGYSGKGVMRRVLHVDASDLDAGPNLAEQMVTLGRKALGEHRRSVLIDGAVPSYSRYVYDKDYYLGDVVMVKNRAGKRMAARVEEQIFVSDIEGFRTYPTLREEPNVLLGTWFSPEYKIFWDNALNEWADQP